jgi:hypothetical protein
MLRDQGIDLLVDLMIGLPGDSEEDVARGVSFLLENELAAHAQVFPLSLLPGTALRASAAADGLSFDPAPPYRVLATETLSYEALQRCLFDAEARLGRRLDEEPRPHLVDADGERRDVFHVALATREGLPDAGAPGAQHVALWLSGSDLFAHRDVAFSALSARLAIDPYALLDVVLRTDAPFPLDLIDALRARLEQATPSYASRALSLRGENLQRRIAVVLPEQARVSPEWLEAVRAEVPVYREQSAREALDHGDALGDTLPCARIMDRELSRTVWAELVASMDPACVAFRERRHERAWVRGVLEHGVA